MDVRVFPPVCGDAPESVTISLPLSKSLSNRRLILDRLAGIDTLRADVAVCDDTDAMISALKAIDESSHDTYINIGAAGTAMRFLTALFAATPGIRVTLDGSERMRHRPIGLLVEALRQLGASIEWAGEPGFPPLVIEGRMLAGGNVELDGSVSSQYVSALMMVAPVMESGLNLRLRAPVRSQPYIAMTGALMERYGAHVGMQHIDNEYITMIIPHAVLSAPLSEPVEPDWSAASYWYEIAALTGIDVILPGLRMPSLQGDAAVVGYFKALEEAAASGSELSLDFSSTPDLTQTLVAAACALGVKFHFSGLTTLRIKETDRLAALRAELAKLGFVLDIHGDEAISWDGATYVREVAPVIATYKDHRMAMALAPLAALFPGLVIADADVVTKSYPGFWHDMECAGFKIEIV